MEMPGEKIYNLIVLKEKSTFQEGRPHCVHLVSKWTRGLEKRIFAVIGH